MGHVHVIKLQVAELSRNKEEGVETDGRIDCNNWRIEIRKKTRRGKKGKRMEREREK